MSNSRLSRPAQSPADPPRWISVSQSDGDDSDPQFVDMNQCERVVHRPEYDHGRLAGVRVLLRTPAGRLLWLVHSKDSIGRWSERAYWTTDRDVASWLLRHPDVETPLDLANLIAEHDATDGPPPPHEPADAPPSSPRCGPREASVVDYEGLADRLLRDRKAKSAALVRFMATCATASFESIADALYEDDIPTDTTIRTLANRTNNRLVELRSPLRFTTVGRNVVKTVGPA